MAKSEIKHPDKRVDTGAYSAAVEVDTGLHRTGVDLDGRQLESIAGVLHEAPRLNFGGVFTHAGHSYHSKSIDQVKAIAEQERMGVVDAEYELKG